MAANAEGLDVAIVANAGCGAACVWPFSRCTFEVSNGLAGLAVAGNAAGADGDGAFASTRTCFAAASPREASIACGGDG
jgi:hypothetical protein